MAICGRNHVDIQCTSGVNRHSHRQLTIISAEALVTMALQADVTQIRLIGDESVRTDEQQTQRLGPDEEGRDELRQDMISPQKTIQWANRVNVDMPFDLFPERSM